MVEPKERIVITGLGAITPLGTGVPAFWEGVKAAANGIEPLTLVDTTRHSTRFGGEVKNFNPEDFIERKDMRKMDRFVQLSVVASDEAVKHSELKIDKCNGERVGVV